MYKHYLILLPLSLCFFSAGTLALDKDRAGQLVKKSNLFQQASQSSEIVSSLEAKEPVIVKSRKRAWYFISQDNKVKETPLSG